MTKQTIYTVGGTVQAGGGIYIKRKADDDLLGLCRQGELAFILSSRQVGKSSLLVRTASQLETENIRSVVIDLSSIGVKVSRDEWYQGILSEIETTLNLETNVFGWWAQYAQLGPAQRLNNFFRDVLLKEVKEHVVLFFDEIDSTLSIPFADDFYTAIRAVYNARSTTPDFKRLSFVLVGVATPGDLIADNKRTPFNIGQRVELNDFSPSEALPLATGLGEHAGQVLAWIFHFTGGHPYLTQRLCAHLAKPGNFFDEHAVERAVDELFIGEQGEQDNNLQFVRNMLAKRSPDVRKVLSIYKKIRFGNKVSDDEHSIPKSHLKLSGLVRSEKGILQVRNEIYRKVFDQEWVKKNTEINWRLLISYSFALLAIIGLISLSFLVYKDVQYISNQPKISPVCFNRDPYPEKKLECLADLFNPDTKIIPYENSVMARELFFSQASWTKQKSIFTLDSPNPDDLEVVVRGLYTNLADVDGFGQNLKLLLAMQEALKNAKLESSDLEKEIQFWVQARELTSQADYASALDMYNQAISLNSENPATLFERARLFTRLGNYESALVDYEQVIAISPKLESETVERPTSTSTLTPTSTLTSTPTRTPTLTPTSTSTATSTSTPYTEYTLTPVVVTALIPTATPIIQLSETPVPTPIIEPTIGSTPTPDDTPVQSKFLSLIDRIDAVKNDINQNEALYSFLITTSSGNYPNLNEWGILPTDISPISGINLVLVTPTTFNQQATSTISTQSIFSLTNTATYPALRIVDWKIINKNCNTGKVTIELVLEGGLSPYNFNTNISTDKDGIAHAVVTSADRQFATVDIPICGRDSDATGIVTTPPIIITTQSPINTPDFPQKECNDNYDNDNDGRIDYPDDPDCTGKNDDNEGDGGGSGGGGGTATNIPSPTSIPIAITPLIQCNPQYPPIPPAWMSNYVSNSFITLEDLYKEKYGELRDNLDLYAVAYYNNRKALEENRYNMIDPQKLSIEKGWTIFLPPSTWIDAYRAFPIPILAAPDQINADSTISISGSSVLYPLSSQIAKCFSEVTKINQIQVKSNSTELGLQDYCQGNADIFSGSEEINEQMIDENGCAGIKFHKFEVARYAITIIINEDNPNVNKIRDVPLTSNQLEDLLISASSWNEVRSDFSNQPINRYYPTRENGTFNMIRNLLFPNRDVNFEIPNLFTNEDDYLIASKVVNDINSIGITGYGAYQFNIAKLRAIPINGISPNLDTLIGENPTYPLINTVFLYTGETSYNENPLLRYFISYYLAYEFDFLDELGYFYPSKNGFLNNPNTVP